MPRGRRLSACALGVALLSGTAFGVAGASGHGAPVPASHGDRADAALTARAPVATAMFVVAHPKSPRLAVALPRAESGARAERPQHTSSMSPGASAIPSNGGGVATGPNRADRQGGGGWGGPHGDHGNGGGWQAPGHSDHGNGGSQQGEGEGAPGQDGSRGWIPGRGRGHGHADQGGSAPGLGANPAGVGVPGPQATGGGHGPGVSAQGGGSGRPTAPTATSPGPKSPAGGSGPSASTPRRRSTSKRSSSSPETTGRAGSLNAAGRLAPTTTPTGRFERAVAAVELAKAARLVPVLAADTVALGGHGQSGAAAPASAASTGGSGSAGAARHQGSRRARSGSRSYTVWQMIKMPFGVPFGVPFIPRAVWIVLSIAVALAAIGAGAALGYRRRARRHAGQVAVATAAALTDPLTGTLNRRGFTEAVERELARSSRYNRPFVLAYADVRGLKAVNDSEGHLAGDELLKGVTNVLGASARAHDVVGRVGGDEFAVLLPEQNPRDADVVTNRIKERVQSTRTTLGFGSHWDLTVGTAAFPNDGQTAEELIATADRRLYEQRGIELAGSR